MRQDREERDGNRRGINDPSELDMSRRRQYDDIQIITIRETLMNSLITSYVVSEGIFNIQINPRHQRWSDKGTL